jgi:hypothetical protein
MFATIALWEWSVQRGSRPAVPWQRCTHGVGTSGQEDGETDAMHQ